MLNHIVLIGRLVRDPELRYTSNGRPVCTFTLAVERNYTNQQGERDVDFIDIVTWQKLAETCAKHLGKGRLVAVDGRLQIRSNKTEERTYINAEVVANNVQFLDWPSDSDNNSSNSNRKQSKESNIDNKSQKFEQEDDFDVPF